MVFVAKTVLELGGRNKAVFFVLLGLLIAPSNELSQNLLQPVVFSQLFWTLAFYALVKFAKRLDKTSLWQLTIYSMLGFLSKYDAVFFLAGLASLVFLKRTRNALVANRWWIQLFIAIVCITPNIIWQIVHHFPAIQMFSRLYETQLDKITRLATIKTLLLEINPIVTLLLLVPGIIYLIRHYKNPHVAPLTIAIAISFILLLYKNGKAYYFYPITLTIFPFGAVLLEQIVSQKRKWLFYPITSLLLLGIVLIPFGMPVYTFVHYLKKVYPIENKKIKGGQYSIGFEAYYAKEKWQTTMCQLKAVYDSLSPTEQRQALLWGKHYGQAGAINLYRAQYNLPEAFSYHGSFYSWAPHNGKMPSTIIALSYDVGDFFQPYFNQVQKVRTIYNPYSDNEEQLYQFVYICKEPKQDFMDMKRLFKDRIFE